MIESNFKIAAEKYKGTYEISHFNVAGNRGSINPISIYTLSMPYQHILIKVKYEFGNHNLAEVTFEIPDLISTPDFRIETHTNFSRLFASKKNPWKIITKNSPFTDKIINLLRNSGLTKMANKTSCEPTIIDKNTNGIYVFCTILFGLREQRKLIRLNN